MSTVITEKSIRISTDKLPLGVKLMPHQRALLYKMILVENDLVGTEKSYTMMSDKPGAGKTFAVLTMIYFMDKILFQGKRKHVTLIVVPYNICTQWMHSMERLYGISGKLVSYKILTEYSHIMSLYTNPDELLQYDILLTTSLYFHNIAGTLESLKIVLRRVFFDEADTIQNLLQISLKCKMTWFVSASMDSLFNKGSIVNIGAYKLSLEHLKKNDVACDAEFVNSNIVLDQPMTHIIECNNVYHSLLVDVTDFKHQDLLASMDYSFLRSEFLPQIGILDSEYKACNYIFKETEEKRRQKILSKEELEKEYKRLITRDFMKEAEEVKDKIKQTQNIIEGCDRILSVIKYFCSKHDISSEFECKAQPNESKLVKLEETLKHIVTQNRRAQCIVFTNHDAIYRLLFPFLEKEKISYKFLDGGNIRDMDDIIEKYKRREFTVLLADSSMYSCGMNLENTSDIIFVHEMEKSREKQVIGRAQRYGRDGVLNLWYFSYHIQKQKRNR